MKLWGPSSCIRTVSSIPCHRHAALRATCVLSVSRTRKYSQERARSTTATVSSAKPTEYSAKAALTIVESRTTSNPVDPARSVRPPPLDLPERGSETLFIYWYRIGSAYGTFYKEGIKAVWFNYRAAQLLRERVKKELGAKDVTEAAQKRLITRAEWQLLLRSNYDISKLPLFGLLVFIVGEWLPLLVPFIPGAVPRTARIPNQVKGMRLAREERRRISFRQGITEPSQEQIPEPPATDNGRWPMAEASFVRQILRTLREDQLHHLSSTLGLHSRLWDRIQLPPPVFLMRWSLTERLQYLALDDMLLAQHQDAARLLSGEEVEIACEDRGLDTLGKEVQVLRRNLTWWLERQREDSGRGRAVLTMLFRRPNSWIASSKKNE